jgi:hypothetical protein
LVNYYSMKDFGMRTTTFRLAALLMLGLVSVAPRARAALILDLGTGGAPSSCGLLCGANGTTFGWAFTSSSPITVGGIGVWDANSSAAFSTEAGLFTATGALLESAVITTGVSTPVASASTDGEWLFASFAPITLPAGVYVLGNVFSPTQPLAQTSASFTTIPEVTEDGGVQGPTNGGFAAPLTPFSEPIFGPTLETAAVPEPEMVSLLGFGFAAMLLWRARCRPREHCRDDIGASGKFPLRLV